MPNRYTVTHQTPAGANLTNINLTGSATVRVNLSHLILGSDATPADVAGEFIVARTDDAGTGGSPLVENAIDPLSPAALVAAVGGTLTEPTYTTNGVLLMIGLNQRATFTWWAREGFELISALATGDGIGTRCVGMSSGTPNMNCTKQWFE